MENGISRGAKNMKKANAIIFSVIFVVYSLLGISCSSSVGGDDGRSIDSDVVYKE